MFCNPLKNLGISNWRGKSRLSICAKHSELVNFLLLRNEYLLSGKGEVRRPLLDGKDGEGRLHVGSLHGRCVCVYGGVHVLTHICEFRFRPGLFSAVWYLF